MTEEEAGQRILEGNVWKECVVCQGGGMGRSRECTIELLVNGSVWIEPRVVVAACPHCSGYGEYEGYTHEVARIILGLEKPVSKRRQYKMRIALRDDCRLLRVIESPARFGVDEIIVQHHHRGLWTTTIIKPTNEKGGWEPKPQYRPLEMRK